MFKVAVVLKTDESLRKIFTDVCPEADYLWDAAVTEENIGELDAVIGNIPPALLKHAGKLKLLQLNTAGVNEYTTAPGIFAREDTALCSAVGAYGVVLSEYMVTAHLMLLKNMLLYRDNMKKPVWEPRNDVQTVFRSTVLVLGAGNIGRNYALRVRAMGAKTIGIRRSPSPLPEFDEVYSMAELDRLLPEADCVAMCLPATPETVRVMTRERLFRMKKGAVLVNAGRGNAVDPEGLYDALTSGHLRGAAIDVTDPEPLPLTSPLWQVPNLLITPHSAGGMRVRYTVERICEIAAHNLRAVMDGKIPEKTVDKNGGY